MVRSTKPFNVRAEKSKRVTMNLLANMSLIGFFVLSYLLERSTKHKIITKITFCTT